MCEFQTGKRKTHLANKMSDSLEQRLAQLEHDVAILKAQIPNNPNWIAEVSGICQDAPDFDEIVRLGKELRDAEPPDVD